MEHVISGVRVANLRHAVAELVQHAHRTLGFTRIDTLSDRDKEMIIGMVVNMGALMFRNAVADIARSLDMSRTSVYNNIKRQEHLLSSRKGTK